jgi:WD40 repeat protein
MGALVAMCFLAGSVVAGEAKPPELILPLRHTSLVYAVAMSDDGKCVLTGSFDGNAILWDVNSGKPFQILKGHKAEIGSVALSASAKRILTGSLDDTSILWDASTGKQLRTFKASGSSVALSLDGKRALTAQGDKTAVLWDADTGKPIQSFKGHKENVSSVALLRPAFLKTHPTDTDQKKRANSDHAMRAT